MTIIARLNELCGERGWTLKRLSEEAGLSESIIYKWKNGKEPTTSTIKKLCNALGITEFQFFTGCFSDELSEEQKHLLERWGKLKTDERDIISSFIDMLILKPTKENISEMITDYEDATV